ncbi:MAG TPA: DUF3052 domain-containing protein [Acidimicrobiia bacterium]|nr:DUF3052 domain-containing protein [Acidimicrobiia bacterium]
MTAHLVGKQRGAVAGYSGTPLAKKLGIKPGGRVAVVSAPNGFTESLRLPPRSQLRTQARGRVDVVVFFVTRRAELVRRFPAMQRCLEEHGGLWIAWPKRASGVPTDLTENNVRELGLGHGLVDNKVAAIDTTWSGLRFVYRVADRGRR